MSTNEETVVETRKYPFARRLEELGVSRFISPIQYLDAGLIIFNGQTGVGKTTTAAGLIQTMHQTRELRIMTIEDPVEAHYGPGKSEITQWEAGKDAASMAAGARILANSHPDVLQIGELRDSESAVIAIEAAQDMLVLTSTHVSSPDDVYESLSDLIPVGKDGKPVVALDDLTVVVVHHEWVRDAGGSLQKDAENKRILDTQVFTLANADYFKEKL
jgi:Tfp pilus assembly pilus retraction ATPase PilT